MNPILARIAEGRYEAGWTVFRLLRRPTAEDERLAAVCLFNLQRLQEAKDLLLRSRARGCAAAGIELATVYRQLGQWELSREALAGVDLDRLATLDGVLALREQGAQLYTAGDVLAASEVLERAWALSFESPDGELVRPSVGHALGVAYADGGLDRLAADYLTRALETANPARATQIHAARALCLTYIGDFGAAQRDLDAGARGRELVPLVGPFLRYVAGALHAARGRLDEADQAYAEAADAARAAHEPETEAHAVLGRCAVAAVRAEASLARGLLERARRIVLNDKGRALLALREAALIAKAQPARAVPRLEGALAAFARHGLRREEAWACVHLAAAQLAAGRERAALAALARATDLRHALGGGASVAAELRALPEVAALLAGLPDGAYARTLHADLLALSEDAPATLELVTLGAEALHHDGRPVAIELRRAVEVLAYLLENPDVPLERVLLDLFPERDAAHGRSYFHQVRYALARAVPGLAVPFDASRGTYRVRCEGLEVVSDLDALRHAVARGGEVGLNEALARYRGPFLPHADGEWATEAREETAWSVMRLGLSVLRERYARGDHLGCRRLAERLLEVDPLHVALMEYLVTAVEALEGPAAAHGLAEVLRRRFERELGPRAAAWEGARPEG